MSLNKTTSILMILFVCFLQVPISLSSETDLGSIDKNESYDIHFGSVADGEAFIIRRVKVVRIERINDIEFLVFINDAGFNAKGKEGFVLFSKVQAIVPTSTFTINGIERVKQY